MWPCWDKASKLDPRADPRSVTITGLHIQVDVDVNANADGNVEIDVNSS